MQPETDPTRALVWLGYFSGGIGVAPCCVAVRWPGISHQPRDSRSNRRRRPSRSFGSWVGVRLVVGSWEFLALLYGPEKPAIDDDVPRERTRAEKGATEGGEHRSHWRRVLMHRRVQAHERVRVRPKILSAASPARRDERLCRESTRFDRGTDAFAALGVGEACRVSDVHDPRAAEP